MGPKKKIVFSLAVAALVLAASPVLAAAPSAGGRLDGIVDIYMNAAASWESVLLKAALGIFGILATIELTWTLIGLALSKADMGDYISELAKKLIMIGFFLFLLTSAGPIAHAIIDTFRDLGNDAAIAGKGSGGLRPTALFDAGMKAAWGLFNTKTGFAPAQIAKSFTLMIAGIVVVICFAVLTAFLIAGLVESYLVTAAGMLMFGLGGSRWTKDFAVKQLTYCVSVGAKLLIIQLLAGTAEAMMVGWTGTVQGATYENLGEIMTIVGAAIIMMALVMTLPNIVQGVINGASAGNGGVMGAAAMFAGGAAATGAALAGGAMGAGAAMNLAGEQVAAKQASGAMGGGFMQSAAGIVGHTIGNLGSAAASDVGGRLSGRARFGTTGGRMADQMNSKANEMKAGRMKAQAAATEGPKDGGPEATATNRAGAPSANSASESENTIRGGADRGQSEASMSRPTEDVPGADSKPEMVMAEGPPSATSLSEEGGRQNIEAAAQPTAGPAEAGDQNAIAASSPVASSNTGPVGSAPEKEGPDSPAKSQGGQQNAAPDAQRAEGLGGVPRPKAVMSVSAAEAAEMGAFEESALGLDDVTKAAISQSVAAGGGAIASRPPAENAPAGGEAPTESPVSPPLPPSAGDIESPVPTTAAPALATAVPKSAQAPARSGLKPGATRRNDALRDVPDPARASPPQSLEPPATDDTPPLEDDED